MEKFEEIEVAFLRSTLFDAAGAGDGRGKGETPKEEAFCGPNLGHAVKNRMTVIRWADGALSDVS